jgi:hypothetical protein
MPSQDEIRRNSSVSDPPVISATWDFPLCSPALGDFSSEPFDFGKQFAILHLIRDKFSGRHSALCESKVVAIGLSSLAQPDVTPARRRALVAPGAKCACARVTCKMPLTSASMLVNFLMVLQVSAEFLRVYIKQLDFLRKLSNWKAVCLE